MSKHYPYLENKTRLKKLVCERCGKESSGYNLEWQVSWFRGDDEYEKICDNCFKKQMKEDGEKEKRRQKREMIAASKSANFWESMKKRVEEKYEVKYLTEYQWRINGVLDLFIVNRRYHDIEKNERGDYSDMHRFLKEYFNLKESEGS